LGKKLGAEPRRRTGEKKEKVAREVGVGGGGNTKGEWEASAFL